MKPLLKELRHVLDEKANGKSMETSTDESREEAQTISLPHSSMEESPSVAVSSSGEDQQKSSTARLQFDTRTKRSKPFGSNSQLSDDSPGFKNPQKVQELSAVHLKQLNESFGYAEQVLFAEWVHMQSEEESEAANCLCPILLIVRSRQLQLFLTAPLDQEAWKHPHLQTPIFQTSIQSRPLDNAVLLTLPTVSLHLQCESPASVSNLSAAWTQACCETVQNCPVQSFFCHYGYHSGVFTVGLEQGLRLANAHTGQLQWSFRFSQFLSSCDDGDRKIWLQFSGLADEDVPQCANLDDFPENMTVLLTPENRFQYTQILQFDNLTAIVLTIRSFLYIRLQKLSTNQGPKPWRFLANRDDNPCRLSPEFL
ncbi:hypothetical protein Ciccas_004346 [Cichlidogyrus casuarinus]|uniref:Uncharacterized protein n=1 Tax=Cichlidogyrus casuarinus TaxID=1844966 RepID=A0ABD2QBV3_9PLAT